MNMSDIEFIEHETPIQKFFSNSSVFITGGTGFLGRLLIEKLLRSCPDILRVYVLMRNKKGKGGKERLQELLNDRLYNAVKEKDKNIVNKVVAVVGDCALTDLGLNAEDKDLLLQNVHIVFHAAAFVPTFQENFKTAVSVNVSGTNEVLNLCKAMAKLKSFVFVSTAYSHSTYNIVSEKFYPSPTDPKNLMNIVKNLNDTSMTELTNKLLGIYQNSYIFTKAVAEELVKDFGKVFPTAIIRPSLVISTYREPYPGYVHAVGCPTGIIPAISCGLLKTIHCIPEKTANIVPADMCVNAMIAISMDSSRLFPLRPNECNYETPIYHFESSRDQPITWFEYLNKTVKNINKWPAMQAVWYRTVMLQKRYFVHLLTMIFFQMLPGLFCDLFLGAFGRKPWLTKTYRLLLKLTNDLSYYTTKNFIFVSRRMHFLIDRLTPEDQRLFFCDLRELYWDEYFDTYFLGMRVYLMRDPAKTVKAARQKHKRLYAVNKICKLILYLIVIFLIFPVQLSREEY